MSASIQSKRDKLPAGKNTLEFGSAFSIPYANRDQARRGVPDQSDFYFSLDENRQVISDGRFQCIFRLPAGWEGKQVFAHFTEAKSAVQVWLNGQEASPMFDQPGAAEFNLTAFLQPGENHLEVQTHPGTEFHGFLWAVSEIHIREFRITTTPATGDQAIGWIIAIEAAMRNLGAQLALNHRIETMLFDPWGIPVWIGPLGVMVSIEAGQETPAAFSYQVKKVRPWSREDPYLYTLILEMRDADGTLLDLRSVQVGFSQD